MRTAVTLCVVLGLCAPRLVKRHGLGAFGNFPYFSPCEDLTLEPK